MTHLLLTLALVAQATGGGESRAGKPEGKPAAASEKAVPAKGQIEAPKAGARARPGMSEAYKKELQEAVAKRRAAAHKRALTYHQKTRVEAAVAQAMRE